MSTIVQYVMNVADVFLLVVVALIMYVGYNAIRLLLAKHRLSGFVRYCNLFGYLYDLYFGHKGKGLIYRKELSKFDMDYLLKKYGYTSIEYPTQSSIYEYIAIIDYPYWEEHVYEIIKGHGGRRFFHFFSLAVNKDGKTIQRPYENVYIDDCKGEFLYDCIQIDGKLIEGSIDYAMKYSLEKFVDDELKYWQNL